MKTRKVGLVILAFGDDDIRPFRRQTASPQLLVESVFVTSARGSIDGNKLRLEMVWIGVLKKVCDHLFEHDIDALRQPCEFLPLRTPPLNKVLYFLVLQLHFGAHLLKTDVQSLLVDCERHLVPD